MPVVFEGDGLRLVQSDPIERHDVVSVDLDPVSGLPIFGNAEPLEFGDSEVIPGVAGLEPGFYPFVCSIHGDMYGLLEVTERPL